MTAESDDENADRAAQIDDLRAEMNRIRRETTRRLQSLEERIEALDGPTREVAAPAAGKPPPETEPPGPRLKSPRRRPDTRQTAARALARQRAWLVEAASVLTPVAAPLRALTDLLAQYRAEGKLPALLMSLAGGVALVLGSGFLLQYSFNTLLSETARVALVALMAVGITGLGTWISASRDAMSEYGASVIAIGLSIAYLAVWFAGPGYGLVGLLGETLGVAFVTATAYGLALRFETRITASLTVIGGAAAPFVMTGGAPDPAAYALLLTLLAFAGVHLALRIRWRGLILATFAFTTVPLDWVMSVTPAPTAGLIAAHVLFYLYTWSLLFDGLKVRSTATRAELGVVVANLALFAAVVYWLPGNATVATAVLAANVIPFAAFALSRVASGSNLAPLFMLTAGVLALVALFAQLTGEWFAVGVAIEGALLVHLGFQLEYRSVRIKGLALLAGALACAVWHTALWAFAGAQGWDATLASMPGALVLLGVAAWLYSRQNVAGREAHVRRTLLETAACTFALTVLVVDWVFLTDLALVLAPVPMYLLLWWAARHRLRVTECVALAHFALFAVEVALGITATGTTRFTSQPFLAQIARVELFFSLWIWGWFYARYYREGLLYPVSRAMREAFFLLLPIGLLPSLERHFPTWFPVIMWAAVVACWEIQRRVTALRFIAFEHTLLAAIAAFLALTSAFQQYGGASVHGFPAVVAGLLYLGALLRREHGLAANPNPALEPIFVGSAWYLAGCAFGVGFALAGVAGGFALATVSLGALLARRPLLRPLRQRLRVVAVPLAICAPCAAIAANVGHAPGLLLSVALVASSVTGVWLAYGQDPHARAARFGANRPTIDVWLHTLIALGYVSILPAVGAAQDGVAFTVLLTSHATAVLFATLRHRFRRLLWVSLSLFGIVALKILLWDMSDFSLVEKIVAFMIIGGLLMGAAYAYQRLRNRQTPGRTGSGGEFA